MNDAQLLHQAEGIYLVPVFGQLAADESTGPRARFARGSSPVARLLSRTPLLLLGLLLLGLFRLRLFRLRLFCQLTS